MRRPRGRFAAGLFVQAGLEKIESVVHDRPGRKVAHDLGCLCWGDALSDEVDVHFLKDLHTDGRFTWSAPALLDQSQRHRALGGSIEVVGVEEDVGVEKSSGAHALDRGSGADRRDEALFASGREPPGGQELRRRIR